MLNSKSKLPSPKLPACAKASTSRQVLSSQCGFTFLEALIVLGLISVVFSSLVSFIKPVEFSKKARDAKRLSDLNALRTAVSTYIENASTTDLDGQNYNLTGADENQSAIYVSTPTAAGQLAQLTDPNSKTWLINHTSSDRLISTDGSGWLPLNFKSLTKTLLTDLPIDPINSDESKYFYSYVFNRQNQTFELNANLEAADYQATGKQSKTANDGGNNPNLYEVGSNLCLLPDNLYGYSNSNCVPPYFARSYKQARIAYAFSDIQPIPNGGYVASGARTSFEAFPPTIRNAAWVVKFNESGNIQWQKSYGSDSLNVSSDNIQPTADNGFIVGSRRGIAAFWVMKLDEAGNVIWQKTYDRTGKDDYHSLTQPTADGGYISVGATKIGTFSGTDALVLKLDAAGNIIWQKRYDAGTGDTFKAVRQTADGGYILIGNMNAIYNDGESNRIVSNIWVVKVDANGNVQWQKRYGDQTGAYQYSSASMPLQLTTDGGFIVGGSRGRTDIGPPAVFDTFDFVVFKLDGNGNIQWQKAYGGNKGDSLTFVQKTAGDDYLVGGSTQSFGPLTEPPTLPNTLILKLDASGNIQWQKMYGGGNSNDRFNASKPITGNGYYLVGDYFKLCAGCYNEAWLSKIEANGELVFNPSSGLEASNTNAVTTPITLTIVATNATTTSTPLIIANTTVAPIDTNVNINQQAP